MKDLPHQLQQKNIRLTALKEALLQVFKNKKKPLTVPELQHHLAKKRFTPNKTSLYRHLENLCQKSILQKISLDTPVMHYELQTHHHHHFTCTKCDTIHCVGDENLEESIHQLEKKLSSKGLSIQKHQFSLSGLCQSCSS